MKVVSEPLCSRERQSTTQDTDRENCPGHRTQIKKIAGQWIKGCQGNCWTAAFIWLKSFLNSKPLTYNFILLIKRVGWKWNLRWSVRTHTRCLLRSPAIWIKHPPVKIQFLSLLVGLVVTGSTNTNFSSFKIILSFQWKLN